MAKFKFPRNPGVEQESPFEGENGENPFGEKAKGDLASDKSDHSEDANPYTAQDHEEIRPYCPSDYENFLPHRGRLIFWAGTVGVGVQLVAICVAIIAILLSGDFLFGITWGFPWQLFGLAVSLPAWILGHSDMTAINAGAMKADGAKAVRTGLRLGILATIFGVSQLLLFIGLLIFNDYLA